MPPLGIPYCPKCPGKPTDGQRKITASERDSLRGALRQFVEARFDVAHQCLRCRACYSFRDGYSAFLGYVPRSLAKPLNCLTNPDHLY